MPTEDLNVGGGQFAQATGGSDALRTAMQKRGLDTAILDRVSATAPGGQSLPGAPATNNIAPQGAAAVPTVPAAAPAPTPQPAAPARSTEMEIAMKAMDSVIKTENSIAKQALAFGR